MIFLYRKHDFQVVFSLWKLQKCSSGCVGKSASQTENTRTQLGLADMLQEWQRELALACGSCTALQLLLQIAAEEKWQSCSFLSSLCPFVQSVSGWRPRRVAGLSRSIAARLTVCHFAILFAQSVYISSLFMFHFFPPPISPLPWFTPISTPVSLHHHYQQHRKRLLPSIWWQEEGVQMCPSLPLSSLLFRQLSLGSHRSASRQHSLRSRDIELDALNQFLAPAPACYGRLDLPLSAWLIMLLLCPWF